MKTSFPIQLISMNKILKKRSDYRSVKTSFRMTCQSLIKKVGVSDCKRGEETGKHKEIDF